MIIDSETSQPANCASDRNRYLVRFICAYFLIFAAILIFGGMLCWTRSEYHVSNLLTVPLGYACGCILFVMYFPGLLVHVVLFWYSKIDPACFTLPLLFLNGAMWGYVTWAVRNSLRSAQNRAQDAARRTLVQARMWNAICVIKWAACVAVLSGFVSLAWLKKVNHDELFVGERIGSYDPASHAIQELSYRCSPRQQIHESMLCLRTTLENHPAIPIDKDHPIKVTILDNQEKPLLEKEIAYPIDSHFVYNEFERELTGCQDLLNFKATPGKRYTIRFENTAMPVMSQKVQICMHVSWEEYKNKAVANQMKSDIHAVLSAGLIFGGALAFGLSLWLQGKLVRKVAEQ